MSDASHSIQFGGYSFKPNKACLICDHVFEGSRIEVVAHDDDGWLQFLCGGEHDFGDPASSRIVGLEHLVG